jgi:hypothetical protein
MKHIIYLTIIAALSVALYDRDTDATVYKQLLNETSKHVQSLEIEKSGLIGMLSHG